MSGLIHPSPASWSSVFKHFDLGESTYSNTGGLLWYLWIHPSTTVCVWGRSSSSGDCAIANRFITQKINYYVGSTSNCVAVKSAFVFRDQIPLQKWTFQPL
jgi:hypothetical protein